MFGVFGADWEDFMRKGSFPNGKNVKFPTF